MSVKSQEQKYKKYEKLTRERERSFHIFILIKNCTGVHRFFFADETPDLKDISDIYES